MERSATKLDEFGKEANQRTVAFLAQTFVPAVLPALSTRVGSALRVEASGQDVLIHYPQAFSLDAIQPQIRLEIGPMAAWIPNEPRPIPMLDLAEGGSSHVHRLQVVGPVACNIMIAR